MDIEMPLLLKRGGGIFLCRGGPLRYRGGHLLYLGSRFHKIGILDLRKDSQRPILTDRYCGFDRVGDVTAFVGRVMHFLYFSLGGDHLAAPFDLRS